MNNVMSLGIYFEITDAELYGGKDSIGYAATRGKYERLMNPAYMKRYYRGNDTEYQDIYSMKPSEVLARHKVMQDVKFSEAPPDDTIITKIQGEINAERKQRLRPAI